MFRIPVLSMIIPVYKSEANLPPLLEALAAFARANREELLLECVFVVDGSPDDSHALLKRELPKQTDFRSQLHLLSRNFGASFATRSGLSVATGDFFCPFAADLQEPLDFVQAAFRKVAGGEVDICFGERIAREDPWTSKIFSGMYWWIYRRLIEPAIPNGGADLLVCNRRVRDEVLKLREQNIFMIGLMFWMGFRRAFLPYKRAKRTIGRSSWTFRKKLNYLMDSLFLFSDLPLKVLSALGALGLGTSFLFAFLMIVAKLKGTIPVPGYAATVTVVCFFGGLNSFGLGIIGEYLWRTFENTKGRPMSIVMESHQFNGDEATDLQFVRKR